MNPNTAFQILLVGSRSEPLQPKAGGGYPLSWPSPESISGPIRSTEENIGPPQQCVIDRPPS